MKEYKHPAVAFTEKGKPLCVKCGKRMTEVKDRLEHRYNNHNFRCACMPKNLIVLIG